MKQHCKGCAKEFEAREENVKRGWGLFCSKSCAAKSGSRSLTIENAAKRNFVKFIDKFKGQCEFPLVAPKSINDTFTIICQTHGDVETTLANARDNKFACWKCGLKHQVIKEGEKECTKCKAWKPLSDYSIEKGKRPKAICKNCDRERKRIGAKEAWDKNKQRAASDKWRAENKPKKERPQFSRCIVFKCEECGVLSQHKGSNTKRFCSATCARTKKRGVLIVRATKEYKCRKCAQPFTNTSPGTCSVCKAKALAVHKNAQKKKRRALLRTQIAHTIVDTKVFARDKWRCKMCCCVVQKQDIYKDNAAEVDHIVPLSLGGPHTYSNVQTLCRKCNQAKSNKYNGQLVLAL